MDRTRPTGPPVDHVPTLVELAELIDHACQEPAPATFVSVDLDRDDGQVELGLWAVPPVGDHPLDALVGFRAPQRWDALGIVCTGRQRRLDDPSAPPVAISTTLLADRTGGFAAVLSEVDGPSRTITDAPEGLGADVLSRALGRPTPPAQHTTGLLVELTWLDRIAAGLLARPARGRSWRWVAERHPLRAGGPTPEPDTLALRTRQHALATPWSELRRKAATTPLPAATSGPPGGTVLDLGEWFDDGALARWTVRSLPPPEPLLEDLLSVLPAHVGDELTEALTEVEAPAA